MTRATAEGMAGQPVSRLAELVFEHRASLEARATRILRDPVEAADVVQEAFFKFMVAAPDLANETQALAYLRTTVTNLSISLLRRKQVRPTLTVIDETSIEDEFIRATALHVDNDEALIRAEDAAVVRLALSQLTPAQRRVLVMREVSGLEIEEIAREFGIKPGNARVIIHRAREAFRHALETTIVDAERGLTAADVLSVTLTRASKTAGRVAITLILPVLLFLGFQFGGGRFSDVADSPTIDGSHTPSALPSGDFATTGGPTQGVAPTSGISSEVTIDPIDRTSAPVIGTTRWDSPAASTTAPVTRTPSAGAGGSATAQPSPSGTTTLAGIFDSSTTTTLSFVGWEPGQIPGEATYSLTSDRTSLTADVTMSFDGGAMHFGVAPRYVLMGRTAVVKVRSMQVTRTLADAAGDTVLVTITASFDTPVLTGPARQAGFSVAPMGVRITLLVSSTFDDVLNAQLTPLEVAS